MNIPRWELASTWEWGESWHLIDGDGAVLATARDDGRWWLGPDWESASAKGGQVDLAAAKAAVEAVLAHRLRELMPPR